MAISLRLDYMSQPRRICPRCNWTLISVGIEKRVALLTSGEPVFGALELTAFMKHRILSHCICTLALLVTFHIVGKDKIVAARSLPYTHALFQFFKLLCLDIKYHISVAAAAPGQ